MPKKKIERVVLGEGMINKINLGEANLGLGLYKPRGTHYDLVQLRAIPYGKRVRLIAEVLE